MVLDGDDVESDSPQPGSLTRDGRPPPKPKLRWAPDSWVRVLLVAALAGAFIILTAAMAIRALVPAYNVDSATIGEIFQSFLGLFGVALGYTLGKHRGD